MVRFKKMGVLRVCFSFPVIVKNRLSISINMDSLREMNYDGSNCFHYILDIM